MVKESEEKRIESRDVVDVGAIKAQVDKFAIIERRLNEKMTNKEFREDLFKNPIDILRQEGVILPKNKEQSVIEFFNSAMVPQEAKISVGMGDGVSPLWYFGIFIRITF